MRWQLPCTFDAAFPAAANVAAAAKTDGSTEKAGLTDDPYLLTVCDSAEDVLVR